LIGACSATGSAAGRTTCHRTGFSSASAGRAGGGYGPLTPSGVEQVIQDLGTQAGIGKRVYHTSLAMIQNVCSHLTPNDTYEAMVRTLAEDDTVPAAASGSHLPAGPQVDGRRAGASRHSQRVNDPSTSIDLSRLWVVPQPWVHQ
jgi:hypothetical protein